MLLPQDRFEKFGTLLYSVQMWWIVPGLGRSSGVEDGWREAGRSRGGSDDGVGPPEADAAGKLLQQAGDGTGGAGRRRLEAHGGAVGGQEDFPHRLQTGLPLRREGTPGEERDGRKGVMEKGGVGIRERGGSKVRDRGWGELMIDREMRREKKEISEFL